MIIIDLSLAEKWNKVNGEIYNGQALKMNVLLNTTNNYKIICKWLAIGMVYCDKVSKLAILSSIELVDEILINSEDKSWEVISWENSLSPLIKVISQSGLDDWELIIEYATSSH